MVHTFRLSRLALALVFSVVLILSVTPSMQAKRAHVRVTLPSEAEVKEAVTSYMGKVDQNNFVTHIDSITYGPLKETGTFPRFDACVQYQFSPHMKISTHREIFTFQYAPEWVFNNGHGTDIGGHWSIMSAYLNAC